MVVRMRATRSHRGNRRSHHALSSARFSKCSHCGALHRSHVLCVGCGHYKGRMVIDMGAKALRKNAKIAGKGKENKK
ncbi:MAG: 50S ribosomal protein L32 [Candidatus Taylorbacteria bacterium RIFCSPLOWO2_01_FULL_44_26]|uniref:Large ribosomal subunit protein bL32 n=2 Tax=Candidatus Tayloriibacteriota TaxID=1817919 RepID=A0A1G2MJR2_9BACT|nr:MAG: 50S ribosomal protein L32 [Candidatus Taylorbacteria bacterium RIFCSPHIGHO2_02_FULL_44_12]OHA30942.1 MAG: 50S ribosomal protein L32 [Candidatus Taylorbacteria bacterium RIFCSPLOWO2_01_FULL_44_26]